MDQQELLKTLDERLDGLTRVRRKQFVTLDDLPLVKGLSAFYEERAIKSRHLNELLDAMPVDMLSVALHSIRNEIAAAQPQLEQREARPIQQSVPLRDEAFQVALLSRLDNLNYAIEPKMRDLSSRPFPHAASRRSRESYTLQSQKTDKFILDQQKAKVRPKDIIAALDSLGHPLPNSVTWANKKSWTEAHMSNRSAVEKYLREAESGWPRRPEKRPVSA